MPPSVSAEKPGILSAQSLVGTFRRFGAQGPTYEIEGVGKVTPDGNDVLLHIRVLSSQEQIDYPFKQAVSDPQAD